MQLWSSGVFEVLLMFEIFGELELSVLSLWFDQPLSEGFQYLFFKKAFFNSFITSHISVAVTSGLARLPSDLECCQSHDS